MANAEVRVVAVGWIKKVVRADWLPSGIESQLEPQRRHFQYALPATCDVFHLRISLGTARIDVYEGHDFCIIWRDKDIVLGKDVEKQVRLCLKAILKGYSGEGKFFMESHEDGKVVSGGIWRDQPAGWDGRVWFWIADGVLLLHVWEVPPIEEQPKGIQDGDERPAAADHLRFEPKVKGK